MICKYCKKPFEGRYNRKVCDPCNKKWKSIWNYDYRQKNKEYYKKYGKQWRKELKELELKRKWVENVQAKK